MYAHYFKFGSKHQVLITPTCQPINGDMFTVSGKKEAREIAKINNATPWNF